MTLKLKKTRMYNLKEIKIKKQSQESILEIYKIEKKNLKVIQIE